MEKRFAIVSNKWNVPRIPDDCNHVAPKSNNIEYTCAKWTIPKREKIKIIHNYLYRWYRNDTFEYTDWHFQRIFSSQTLDY